VERKILWLMVLVAMLLLTVLVCSVALADDGAAVSDTGWSPVDIWAVVAPFATLAAVGWLALIRKQYKLAIADKKLTWWEARCLFIACFTSIWPALKAGFKGFPIGSLLSLLLKIVTKNPVAKRIFKT